MKMEIIIYLYNCLQGDDSGGDHSGGDHGGDVPDNSNAANNGNGILDMWRFDYVFKNSPFVFIAHDGLPDFEFDTRQNKDMFNSTSIVEEQIDEQNFGLTM